MILSLEKFYFVSVILEISQFSLITVQIDLSKNVAKPIWTALVLGYKKKQK